MRIARVLYLLAITSLAWIPMACSSGEVRKPRFPVTGKVLVNGKPAEHASVVFHPVDEAKSGSIRPRGKVASDGSFTLTTYDSNDGAPAGDYRVTLEWWLASKNADEPPSNRLPANLAKVETSKLTATILDGPTNLPAFEVKR